LDGWVNGPWAVEGGEPFFAFAFAFAIALSHTHTRAHSLSLSLSLSLTHTFSLVCPLAIHNHCRLPYSE
jgi:hypothetical protein